MSSPSVKHVLEVLPTIAEHLFARRKSASYWSESERNHVESLKSCHKCPLFGPRALKKLWEHDTKGHSGQIGNTPNLAGKKSKSMLQLFPMHNWCWFEFLKMKKAKGKLKTDYRVFSPPYFETPVSRNDEGFLEVISSPRLWFQVSCKYLNSYSYPSNIVIIFCFNFKLQMPKMRKKWKKLDW